LFTTGTGQRPWAMKRFSNLFTYETTNFYGRYRNCTLLTDVPLGKSKHVYALAGEVFSAVVVNLEESEIYFFEEFDDHVPIFTIHFKLEYC
jgi:hypothetical protein